MMKMKMMAKIQTNTKRLVSLWMILLWTIMMSLSFLHGDDDAIDRYDRNIIDDHNDHRNDEKIDIIPSMVNAAVDQYSLENDHKVLSERHEKEEDDEEEDTKHSLNHLHSLNNR